MKKKGFSLIELLTVVAIIGIIAAIGVVSYQGYITGARKSSASNAMQQIALAQTEYYSNNGEYFPPDTFEKLSEVVTCSDKSSGHIEKELFEVLLFLVLTAAGILLLFNFRSYDNCQTSYKKIPLPIAILIGGILGLISGIVGIGGGIFLSPILFLIRAGKPKYIVTAASLFILINSIFGIIGQLTKNYILLEVSNYWYLLAAVLIGGQVGNFLNLKIFPTRMLALITACLVLFIAIRIGIKIF